MARGDRVTWRLEVAGRWGGRLDPTWLPSGDTEGWRRIFEAEDLAGRVFAAGGGGLRWTVLADTADVGPGGRWRHALLVDGTVETVSEHDGRGAAAASVAAYRGIDEVGIRWAEPLSARA